MREVRARLELEARSHKKPAAEPKWSARPDGRDAKGKKKLPVAKEGATTADAATRAAEAVPEAPDAAVTATAQPDDAAPETADAAAATAAPEAADAAPAKAAARTAIDDEAMDADSTTTVEPKRDDPAKEATP